METKLESAGVVAAEIDGRLSRLQTLGRQAAAVTLAALSLAPATASAGHIKPPHPPGKHHAAEGQVNQLDGVQTQPHLEIWSEDDSAVMSMDVARADRVLSMATAMGATIERLQVHPPDVQRNDFSREDFAVNEMIKNGLEPSLVITCENVNWTTASYYKHVKRVARHFVGRVTDFATCNEPDYGKDTWLRHLPHRSKAQSANILYNVGRRAITQVIPGAVMNYGEATSEGRSTITKFFHDSVACPPKRKACPAVVMDYVSIHPYTLTSPPNKPSRIAGEQGMSALGKIEQQVHKEYVAGRIRTPDGQEPKLRITEIGWWQATRNEKQNPDLPPKLRRRFIGPQQRALYTHETLDMSCSDPRVTGLNFYGFETPEQAWGGWWNTPFIDAEGKPVPAYRTVKYFARNHPECVQTDPGDTSPTPDTAPTATSSSGRAARR